MPAASPRPIDRTIDVAVVYALELEAAPLVKRLRRRRKTIGDRFVVVEGTLGSRRVAVVQIGTKGKRFAAAADAVLFAHRPRWVIAAGFAAGLSDHVHVGAIVLANELANESGGRLAVDIHPWPSADAGPGVCIGRMLSTGSWQLTAAERRQLGRRTGAIATDVQSFTLAKLCAEQRTRFLAIRVVTHDASADFEPGERGVYSPSRSYRAGVLVGAFLSQAGRAGKIWKLRGAARQFAERLGAFLAGVLKRLP